MKRIGGFWNMAFMLALFLGFGSVAVAQQEEDESPETKQYREDYERLQKIVAIPDPTRKTDSLLVFMRERPNSK